MDPRLLRYYNQELRYLREMGGEFAREFPKIAGRLGMEGMEVSDPYVERLIEGCAFLAARVQLKQDAEFPELAQRLIEMVSPNLAAPIPSMLVARVQCTNDPNLVNGFRLPRGSALLGAETALSRTRCEFRTAQDVVLTPVKVTSAEYFLGAADLGLSTLPLPERPRSGVRVKLELPAGLSFSQLKLGSLRFYIGGLPDIALRLHELMVGACVGVLAGTAGRGGESNRQFLAGTWRPRRGPARRGSDAAGRRCAEASPARDCCGSTSPFPSASCSSTWPTSAALSPRPAATPSRSRCCSIATSPRSRGRSTPATSSCTACRQSTCSSAAPTGCTSTTAPPPTTSFRSALPPSTTRCSTSSTCGAFAKTAKRWCSIRCSPPRKAEPKADIGYYSAARCEPRLRSSDPRQREGPRSGYVGTEVYLSLVDHRELPYRNVVRQLGVQVRCTNRDLPLFMPTGQAQGELHLNGSAPIEAIHIVAGPSRPQARCGDRPGACSACSP